MKMTDKERAEAGIPDLNPTMPSSGFPDLSVQEAQEIVSTKTAPKVTEDSIKARINDVRYLRDGTTTICVIEMDNGFEQMGYSKPASPENYDQAVGERYAFEDAFKPLWKYEAYLLLERQHQVALMNAQDALQDG